MENDVKEINQTGLTGASGEHFVMYCLLQRGYIAGLAPERAPNADIIATSVDGKRAAVIQVKTRKTGKDGGWHMKEKHEHLVAENLFYCFVDLEVDKDRMPIVYIIPSDIVAEVITKTDDIWLVSPGRGGRPHRDTGMRRLLPDFSKTIKANNSVIKKYSQGWMDEYKENWAILKLD
jgi:hypothetical protein